MAIEIKGLSGLLGDARRAIAEVREQTGALREDTAAFVADVRDVRSQVKKHHEDFKFEVGTLGNGGPTSEGSEKQSITTADVGDIKQVGL